MALCDCPERARCAWRWCVGYAAVSVMQPKWRCEVAGRVTFMCSVHAEIYRDATAKPMKGIDRPPDAPDDWRGSILEHIRHARIALAFERRDTALRVHDVEVADWEIKSRGWTPAQVEQTKIHRALIRKFSTESDMTSKISFRPLVQIAT
jgi:hypothetical protein